jgi:hypothetical protein
VGHGAAVLVQLVFFERGTVTCDIGVVINILSLITV